jgi:hypothetical protein
MPFEVVFGVNRCILLLTLEFDVHPFLTSRTMMMKMIPMGTKKTLTMNTMMTRREMMNLRPRLLTKLFRRLFLLTTTMTTRGGKCSHIAF